MAEHLEGRPVSASTYRRHGCTCDGCRAAHSTKQLRNREAAREGAELDGDGHVVGKSYADYTYIYYGCRCARCRAAHSAVSTRASRRYLAAWRWVKENRPDVAEQIRQETP